jgi:anti-sigma factor RsiW
MDCRTAREMVLAALAGGEAAPADVAAHLDTCSACAREVRRLGEAWTALGALTALEPSPDVARRLSRQVRWESAREAVASVRAWQRAALAGVGGSALSLVLSLLLPYERLVALCQDIAPDAVPAAGAYLAAGLFYGLLPMAIAGGLQRHREGLPAGLVGALEASVVFLAVTVPYVVAACGFPPPLLVGFVTGIGLGAVTGGAAGIGLRRMAWA